MWGYSGAIVNAILSCYSCPSSYITWAREFFRHAILGRLHQGVQNAKNRMFFFEIQ